MTKESGVAIRSARALLTAILAFTQMGNWSMGADKTKSSPGTVRSGIESKQNRAKTASGNGSWSFNAKIIEACSCRLFCPCYFNTSPDKHFCQFNNAFKVLAGYYGPTDLTDVKFWVSGDLSDDFGDSTALWAAFTFDPAASQEQIDAVIKIIPHIYPLKFEETFIDKKPISWEINGDGAAARIGDGTDGMVELTAFKEKATGKPTVIKNLNYFGAKSNKGFHLHKSKHYYRGFGHEYGFEDANGFVIEIYSSGELPGAHY
ncbi:MAG: DUF1326 domain-containing protein [candidate division Zixibacteria bacterium]|nr:DUF1326 domain-containing protein [candidate division Zixibacteria bacterium]